MVYDGAVVPIAAEGTWFRMQPASKIALTLFFTLSHQAVLFPDETAPPLAAAFEEHCVRCHGRDGRPKGKVDLRVLKSDEDLRARPALLEKLVTVLKDGEMPPEREPPIPDGQREVMLRSLEPLLRESLRSQAFAPTPIRRMNRLQYNNAVVDLLELDRDIFALEERLMRRRDDYFQPQTGKMPDRVRVSCRPLSKDIDNQRPEGFRGVAAFPQDQRAEHGFDNQADHLTLSPLLMESLLRLSQTIVESPDLNSRECGCWDRLFAPPIADGELDEDRALDAAPAAIRERLPKFLRRAFRRPVDPETLERFADFAARKLAEGTSFESTMRTLVGAVLAMPDFLYFWEAAEDEPSENATPGRQRVSEFELASRLALFLWSSIPDDSLLDLAESGRLSDPAVLSVQIDRMLNDRRMSRFCDNFPGQWLQLDRLITAIPDKQKFPHFYLAGYRSSLHMMSEPLLLFDTVFLENRSVLELLSPDFSWRSRMLRANYEGHRKAPTEVQVQVFERVQLDDPRQGGVITNLAVLTMTSTPTRTQPITRGAWVNAVIFNDPPEPPPADVPALPEVDAGALEKLTIRERLAQHREREDCAGCHEEIDPLGFALENYGPTGVWREEYENGRRIDSSGVLFQQSFRSPVEFKSLILQQKERFLRGFLAHILSYALGRKPGPADSPALDEMTANAMAGGDRLRALLKAVAMSEPFLHKNVPVYTRSF